MTLILDRLSEYSYDLLTQMSLKMGHHEIPKSRALSKLSDADKNGLVHLIDVTEDLLRREERSGSLLLVGGSLIKPAPRKDIDLVFGFGGTPPGAVVNKEDPHWLDFVNFADQILSTDGNFDNWFPTVPSEWEGVVKPGWVLAHPNNKTRTPIQIIRLNHSYSMRDWRVDEERYCKIFGRPYSVLVDIQKGRGGYEV